MKLRISSRALVATVAVASLAVGVMAPAHSAGRTTVVVTEPTPLTGLNTTVTEMNLATNSEVVYPTGFGFYYANNQKQLVPNTKFGSWKVIKKSKTDFQVKYTINPGQLWNDGTPIDGVDLLLSHIISSSAYSKAAGLGDPQAAGVVGAFDSLGYAGTYDSHIVGEPVLSSDHMSVTLKYDAVIPDWDQNAPGVFPVHTLELMADGKKKLGSASENAAAKAAFLKDFTSKNTANLKDMGKIWSTAYNITTVNDSTNPLLLVGNGDFKIDSCVDQTSCTLVLDTATNGKSGPKTTGIDKIVFRFDVADTSAPQALANKEIDLYSGQVTADGVAQLKAVKGITLTSAPQSTYEHLDIRTAGPNGEGKYTGPFAGESQKAKDLRRAFLLAVPREDLIEKIIKPTDPGAVILKARGYMPSDGAPYTNFIANNGSSAYSASYAARMAEATKLVKRYQGANYLKNPIKVHLLFRNNARRTAQYDLFAASWAKVGFQVVGPGIPNWSSNTKNLDYDAAIFAWGANLPVQVGDCPQEESASSNATWGWKNKTIDAACKSLEAGALSNSNRDKYWLLMEKALASEAYTLPLFQWPGVTAINSALNGVKPSPITPNLVWNYWEWNY